MKDQNLLLTTLSKYINLYINHNLTLKLKKIVIPVTQRFPKYKIHSSNTLYTKTFSLTLELNPQIRYIIYCLLLILAAYASFVKYKWAIQTHPIFMKFYRATPLDV